MMHMLAAALVSCWLGLVATASVDETATAELEAHLAALRRQAEDQSIAIDQRARIVLEMAASLDRAAQAATDPQTRRQRWSRAVEVLDGFRAQLREPALADQLQFQAAIYLW